MPADPAIFNVFANRTDLFLAGIDIFGCAVEAPILPDIFLIGLVRLHAVADILQHFAQTDELIPDHLAVVIQRQLDDISLRHLQIADALRLGGEHGTHLGAQTLSEILQTGADRQAVLGEGGL